MQDFSSRSSTTRRGTRNKKNMTKKKTTAPAYLTREILKKEISASEKRLDAKITGLDVKVDKIEQRLDAKIDIATEVMKAHINSRIAHVDTRFDGLEQKMETRFNKSERYFEQLVGMVVQQNKKIDRSLERLENHEERITVLEGTENGEQEHSMKK